MNITLTNKDQKILYGLEKTFNEISKIYNNGNLPNKILLSGPKGIGKSTFAYHLINFIFSKDEDYKYDTKHLTISELNKSFKLIQNNSHPNFHLIDLANDKKVIEISQIREMINYSNKSSFNNKERIILLDNIEYLNHNSINALLKIIEEPNYNIFFILILDSNKKILSTLKSRCLKFNLSLTHEQSIKVTNNILDDDIINLINPDLLNYYNTPGDYIRLLNFCLSTKIDIKELSLKEFLIHVIDNNYYKKDIFIKNYIYNFVELYLSKLINVNDSKKISDIYTYFINKISRMNKYNLDQESFFIELRSTLLNG
jgi:DNA polymerase III subunit delta'